MSAAPGLRVTLPGELGSDDARRSLFLLERLLALLGQLEDVVLRQPAAKPDERTIWGITSIELGSLTTVLEPTLPQRGATPELLCEVLDWAVDGFATTETGGTTPENWDALATGVAAELAKLLGTLPSDSMVLERLDHGQPVKRVTVTGRSNGSLTAAVRHQEETLGSVIGRLDMASVHGERRAGLWLERTGRRVEVRFRADQDQDIRAAWGKRVEIAGRLRRDRWGRATTIRMQSVVILPDGPNVRPLTALYGADPAFASGQPPQEYLAAGWAGEEVRGAS